MTRTPNAVSRNTQLLIEKSTTEVTDYISFLYNLFSHILLSHFLRLVFYVLSLVSKFSVSRAHLPYIHRHYQYSIHISIGYPKALFLEYNSYQLCSSSSDDQKFFFLRLFMMFSVITKCQFSKPCDLSSWGPPSPSL